VIRVNFLIKRLVVSNAGTDVYTYISVLQMNIIRSVLSSLRQVFVDDIKSHLFYVYTEEFVQAQLVALGSIFNRE
jgi:hypothetical protein